MINECCLPFTLSHQNCQIYPKNTRHVRACVCVQTVMRVCVRVCIAFPRFGGRSTKMSDSFPPASTHTERRPLLHYFKLQTLQPSFNPPNRCCLATKGGTTPPLPLRQLQSLFLCAHFTVLRCSLNCSAAVDALLSATHTVSVNLALLMHVYW